MYSVPLQVAGYWSFLAGLAVLCAATAWSHTVGIRCGGGLLALSLALFGLNLGKILSHFVRPRIQPFAAKNHPAAKIL